MLENNKRLVDEISNQILDAISKLRQEIQGKMYKLELKW